MASKASPKKSTGTSASHPPSADDIFRREYWTGDSRDGCLVNGDGFHFYRMSKGGLIHEAFEVYETDDGTEVVSPLPEMHGVEWLKDLGFQDMEALDEIQEREWDRIKALVSKG